METPEIKFLYQPKDEIVCDLLFMNGIGRNWERDWRCTTNCDATWIRDQLPLELPSLRIACWVGTANNLNRSIEREVQEVADEFLNNLQAFRKNTSGRPIIFVAHSLAGVVLKQALVGAAESTNKSLLGSIAGILLISVPTNFSLNLWKKFLSKVYAPHKATNGSIEKDANPSFIANIQGQFSKLLEKKSLWNPEIYSLYETLPIYRAGVIVDVETAEIPGYDSKSVAANHLSITVLDRETDSLYDWICDWLRTCSSRRYKGAINKPEADQLSETREPLAQVKVGLDLSDRILDQAKVYPEVQRQLCYALLIEDEGLYEFAESLLKTAFKICQKNMKPDHPVVLFCRDRMAHNYRLQGRDSDARNECRAIMDLRMESPKLDKYGMLATVKNQVLILRSESKLQEALETLVKSLESTPSTEASTLDHLSSLHLLASLLNDLGFHKFSEILSRAVIKEHRLRLGSKHPRTLECMSDLAVVFAVRKKEQEATRCHLEAYEGLEMRYGRDHPAVLCVFRRYAMAMLYQGKYDESCEAFETLLPRYQEKMGDEHPACLSAMSGLGAAYILRSPSDGERGRRLLENAFDLQLEHLGGNHRDTIWSAQLLQQLDSSYSGKLSNGEGRNKYHKLIVGKGMIVEGRSDYMPVVKLSSTDSTELKFQFELLKGTRSEVRKFDLETHAKYTNSLYGGLIHIAAYSNNLTLVRQLLDRGVNMNESAGIFRTPMKAADMQGNTEVLEVLERHNQSRSVPDSLSQQSLDISKSLGQLTIDPAAALAHTVSQDPAGTTTVNGELLAQDETTANAEDRNLLSKDVNARLSDGTSNKNPLEKAADNAHSSLTLSMNGLRDESLQDKYQRDLEIFKKMFTAVFRRICTIEGSLANQCNAANLNKKEWKYIESLQARVVMSEEFLPTYELVPAYELEPTPAPGPKSNTEVVNGDERAISSNIQASHPEEMPVAAETLQKNDIGLSPAQLSSASTAAELPPQTTRRLSKVRSNFFKAPIQSEPESLPSLAEEANSSRKTNRSGSSSHNLSSWFRSRLVHFNKADSTSQDYSPQEDRGFKKTIVRSATGLSFRSIGSFRRS